MVALSKFWHAQFKKPMHARVSRLLCVQASGRAASSVQWGAWGGSGMAARVRGFMDRMARMGLGVLLPAQGLAVIGRVLAATASPFQSSPPLSPVLVGACSEQPILRATQHPGCCTARVIHTLPLRAHIEDIAGAQLLDVL